jgi:membrane protein YqaA with SNARE-associated domain
MVADLGVYFGLFSISLLAATILPAHSEIGLAGLIVSGEYTVAWLVLVASVGNTLGSVVNWFLGRGIERFHDRKWFPASPKQMEKATRWYHRYGRWSLLLSWTPFLGDPLTVVAGVLREPLASFIAIVAVAKTVRYLVVAAIAMNSI